MPDPTVTVQGTPHLYGISGGVGVIADCTVISFDLDSEHANKGETVDEIGNLIEERYDDLTSTGTITLRPRAAFTPLTLGGAYTYNTVAFTVISEGRKEQQKGFISLTYKIKKSEFITPA